MEIAMARTQSANYPEVKAAILRKAAQLFARNSYARTSIGDLTKACDASRGTLYHYFANKEAILLEMMSVHIADMGSHVRAAIALSDHPDERLRNIIRSVTALNAQSRNEQIVLMNDLGNLGKAEQARIRAMENQIVDLVLAAVRAVEGGRRMRRRNAKVYAMLVLGMVNYTYSWYDPAGAVSPRELAETAADILLHGLKAK
jgi:AcrR family transcriptional regulator